MSRAFYEDPKTAAFFEELAAKVSSSAVFLLLMPPEEALDLKVCVELGLAIFFDKKIWVMCPPGRDNVGDSLLKIADQIIPLTGDSKADAAALADLLVRQA
jgi:hypothetical protein